MSKSKSNQESEALNPVESFGGVIPATRGDTINDPDFEVGESLTQAFPTESAPDYKPNPQVEPGEEVDPNRPIQGNDFVTHSELDEILERERFAVRPSANQYNWASEFKENVRALVQSGQSGVSDQTFALAERMTDKMLEFIDNKFKA